MELVEAMLQGRLDAAFVRSPVESIGGLIVDPVLDEPMLVALPDAHPLAGSDEALPLAVLAREAFILYRRPAGPGLYDAIVTACRGAEFTPVVAQEAPRLPLTLSLVAAGLGISLVPASMRRVAMAGVSFRAAGLFGIIGTAAPDVAPHRSERNRGAVSGDGAAVGADEDRMMPTLRGASARTGELFAMRAV